jgi:hypothetical protein
MIRVLVISLVLLGSIVLQARAAAIPIVSAPTIPQACQLGKCSYTGDPHLTPFPSAYGQPQHQYWCQHPGWELLLANPYVRIYVLVGPSPYVILDYIVIFPGAPSCVLIGSLPGAQTCPAGTPATSTVSGSGQSWYHFDLTQSIIVEIDQFLYGSAYRYDIYVTQPFYLIDQSTGVCIKWNCSLETPWINPIPIAVQICDLVVTAAQKQALGAVNRYILVQSHTSCVRDLQVTANPTFAQTAIGRVLQDSIKELVTTDNLQAVVARMDVVKQALITTTTGQINNLIANCTRNQQDQCLQPPRTTLT